MQALKDSDYLAARLRGRRARLAEGPRLDALCALGAPAALAAAVLPGSAAAPGALQRALAAAFVGEARWIAGCLGGAWGAYASWQAGRFGLLNVKTALRGLAAGAARGEIAAALWPLPPGEGCGPELAAAAGPGALPGLLRPGPLRASLERALASGLDLFLTEAALDRDYLARQAGLCGRLGGGDGAAAEALAAQESAAFNLLTAARGRFFHAYSKEALLPLYAPGPGLDPRRFARLLAVPSAADLRAPAAGSAVDGGPPEPDLSALEALAWRRQYRLAAGAFRSAATGAGAAAAYLALRRAELANLASVSEGLRLGVEAGSLRRRLIPRAEGGDA